MVRVDDDAVFLCLFCLLAVALGLVCDAGLFQEEGSVVVVVVLFRESSVAREAVVDAGAQGGKAQQRQRVDVAHGKGNF